MSFSAMINVDEFQAGRVMNENCIITCFEEILEILLGGLALKIRSVTIDDSKASHDCNKQAQSPDTPYCPSVIGAPSIFGDRRELPFIGTNFDGFDYCLVA